MDEKLEAAELLEVKRRMARISKDGNLRKEQELMKSEQVIWNISFLEKLFCILKQTDSEGSNKNNKIVPLRQKNEEGTLNGSE